MSITLLGLGPGDPNALTLAARDALEHAPEIFLRTRDIRLIGRADTTGFNIYGGGALIKVQHVDIAWN
jgi:precorrin-6B methylase 1